MALNIQPTTVAQRTVGTSGNALPSQMVGSFQNQQLGGLIAGHTAGQGGETTNPNFQALQNKLAQTSVDLKQRQKGVLDGAKRLTQLAQVAQRNRAVKAVAAKPQVQAPAGGQNARPVGYQPTGRAKGKGQIDISQTIKIGKAYLRADAATEFQRMNAALKAATGKTIGITEGWRSYDRQVQLYNAYRAGKGNVAAKPGTSNHGRGTAVDINGYGGYNSAVFQWLLKNARNFGYSWDTGKASGELWHWEYIR